MTRARGILAGSVLVALAVAFATGRWTARAPAVHDERTVATATKATATVVAKVDTVKHEASTKDVDTTVHTITRWLPAVAAVGGCPAVPAHVEQEVVRETKVAATRTADSKRDAQTQQHVEQQAQATVVELHTVTPAPRPDWSATALVGGQLGGRSLLPAPYVVGFVLERRLIGSVSAGLWATSGMAGGLSLRVDF